MNEIFSSVVDSVLAVPLLGGALVFLLIYQGKRRVGMVHRGALGLAFGIAAALTVRAGYELPGDAGFINGVVGPLLFAAYIGGTLAGLIAFVIAAIARYIMGGDMQIVGILIEAAYVLIGIGLRWWAPFQSWPNPTRRTLVLAIFLVFGAISVSIIFAIGQSESVNIAAALPVLLATYLVNAGSIFLVWFVICDVARVTDASRQNMLRARQMQMLYEEAGVGSFSFDSERGSFNWDESLLDMYGMRDTPPEQRDKAYAALLHPDDRTELMANAARGLAGDRTVTRDVGRVYKTTGEMMFVKRVWQVGDGQDRSGSTAFGLNINLTDFQKLRTEHDTTAERLRLATEGFPGLIYQGIWAPGRVVRHLYLSDKCEKFWGVTPQQAYDEPSILDANKLQEEVEKASEMMVESARNGTAMYSRRKIPAGWIDFFGKATDLGDGTYRIDGVMVDATEEVAAQEEAERQAEIAHSAQRMESIGRLTGGIAHDFNNLLAIIMGNLELLKDDEEDTDRLRFIDSGLEATKRGAVLTRAMLAHARKARLEPEVLDLGCVVRNSKNWMERALPEAVEIETSLLAGLWQARVDRASLESALLNLLLNARDAMNGHGKLTIETANIRIDNAYIDQRKAELEPGCYAMLAVSDTGSGISPDTLEHIFAPFFTTKGPGEGSGMGLAMVEGFVKQSNGTVQIYTEVGEGTTFKLYFPAIHASVSQDARDDATFGRVEQGGDQRILLVEDERQVRQVLSTTLRAAGYHVTEASSGDDALRIFQSAEGFDLLVTDIVMPGTLQGTTLAKAIRVLDPNLPMIFLSGYASEATVHGNGLRPEDIRLMKPVPKADLLLAISDALSR
jgi:signal transduction histidine kinase/CheY-like chemotaxis protein